MRQLRTAIANCIASVTSRRSTDLDFAMASRGGRRGPRCRGNNDKNDNDQTDDGVGNEKVNDMVKGIYAEYREQGERRMQDRR